MSAYTESHKTGGGRSHQVISLMEASGTMPLPLSSSLSPCPIVGLDYQSLDNAEVTFEMINETTPTVQCLGINITNENILEATERFHLILDLPLDGQNNIIILTSTADVYIQDSSGR